VDRLRSWRDASLTGTGSGQTGECVSSRCSQRCTLVGPFSAVDFWRSSRTLCFSFRCVERGAWSAPVVGSLGVDLGMASGPVTGALTAWGWRGWERQGWLLR